MPKLTFSDEFILLLARTFFFFMANSYFQFKKFIIRHDLCAMKVGTDGVLLGAWASLPGCGRVLDVGTGTGLIALMLAQRGDDKDQPVCIDAIDIDPDAARQASLNAEASPFGSCIRVYGRSLAEFILQTDKSYELIVSNPPYFNRSLKCPDEKRNTARHTDSLSLPDLIDGCCRLLSPTGRLALILPADQEDALDRETGRTGLHMIRKTRVIPTPGGVAKRILAEFSFCARPLETDSLVIETSRHQYTPEYIALTKEFYLKM